MPDAAAPLIRTLGAPLPDEFDRLTDSDLAELDRAFPLPGRKSPLEMI